jgi:hypothetical protein
VIRLTFCGSLPTPEIPFLGFVTKIAALAERATALSKPGGRSSKAGLFRIE